MLKANAEVQIEVVNNELAETGFLCASGADSEGEKFIFRIEPSIKGVVEAGVQKVSIVSRNRKMG